MEREIINQVIDDKRKMYNFVWDCIQQAIDEELNYKCDGKLKGFTIRNPFYYKIKLIKEFEKDKRKREARINTLLTYNKEFERILNKILDELGYYFVEINYVGYCDLVIDEFINVQSKKKRSVIK